MLRLIINEPLNLQLIEEFLVGLELSGQVLVTSQVIVEGHERLHLEVICLASVGYDSQEEVDELLASLLIVIGRPLIRQHVDLSVV